MLETERNTDDRKAQDGSHCNMEQGYLNTSYEDPDHVHDDGKAAAVICIRLNVMTERPERQSGYLDELKSERNTDDGNAEENSYKKIVQADHKAAKHKPENVS